MVRVENEAHSSHRSPKIRAKRLLNTSELGKKRGARNREKEEKERRDGSKTRRVVGAKFNPLIYDYWRGYVPPSRLITQLIR